MVLRVLLLNNIFFFLLLSLGCNQSHVPVLYNQTFNGLEEGEWRRYHENGMLKEKRFYRHGVKVGLLKTWWDNGQLQVLYRFKNGEYDGTCFEWNRNGVMTKKMHYTLGVESGEQRQWYDDGSVRSNYVMVRGRRFGLLGTKNCINVKDSLDRF
ncbi:MAG: hypothetical protein RLZ76_1705 [Bacteroidota bacterium]|jgi:antitoxin component YwqK of YwqJK toxin-antitoxin module